jgi:hypothetical protein
MECPQEKSTPRSGCSPVPHCIHADASVIKRAFWPTADFSDVSNFAYTEDPDEVILNGPGTPNVGKLNCRTQAFSWRAPYRFGQVSYNPHSRRILGYDINSKALLELNGDTGTVLREIRSTNLGPLGYLANPRYATPFAIDTTINVYACVIDEDPDLVCISDQTHHVAGILHLGTREFVASFGEYGVAGRDLNHLSSPRDCTLTLGRNFWIADHENHRYLNIERGDGAMTVANQFVFPRPMTVGFTYDSAGSHFFSANAAIATECWYQPLTLVLSDFDEAGLHCYTSLLGWVPIATNRVEFNPWNPSLLQVNQWNSTFEIDWTAAPRELRHMARFAKPYAKAQTLKAGEAFASEPIIGLINDRMALKAYATVPARAIVEVPEPAHRLCATPAEFTWVACDEFAVPANRMTIHGMDHPPAVFRVSIRTEEADGVISVYGEGY